MKIAISSQGTDLSAQVDPRFGRCQYFIIVDSETMQFKVIDNSNAMAGSGAGISTAQMMANEDVQVVLTGNCGPNAYKTLSAAGLQVITSVSGKIQDAIDGYKSGKFQSASEPSVDAHFGMGASGTGADSGKGKDGGKGMGMGLPGPASGWSSMSGGSSSQPMDQKQELEALKNQAQQLKQQTDQILNKIDDLEKKGK